MNATTATNSIDGRPVKKPQDFKNGHEVVLRKFISTREPLTLELTNGDYVTGRVTQFDHFTITLAEMSKQPFGYGPYGKARSRAMKEGRAMTEEEKNLPHIDPEFVPEELPPRTFYKQHIISFTKARV